MNRSNFLKSLGGLIGVSIFAPSMLKALERSDKTPSTLQTEGLTIESIKGSLDHLSEEDRILTEEFFKYLKRNNVGFKWERIYTPIFKLTNGQIYETHLSNTSACFNPLWETGIVETRWQSFSGGTSSFYNPKTIEEYHERLFGTICGNIRSWKKEKIYPYYLTLSPLIYEPMSFQPQRKILFKGATI